jgi:pimeloyl-ACP methyl ester carboxylesterase
VCSYSKFGTGTSDPPATTQTFVSQAADLHSLLEEAGEPGPYVVLGHSFGGAQAVTFASQHPDEVVGLMLLDASPVTWPAAVCAVPDDGTDAGRDARGLCATMQDPTQDPERLDVIPAFEEVAAIASLDDLPMTVMSAARRSWPGLADGELTRLTGVWNEGVDRWAALSTESTTVFVEDTGHHIQLDQPDLVVEQVLVLLPSSS